MRKTAFLALCLLFPAPFLQASPFEDFGVYASQRSYLKPFAEDLGGLLGAMNSSSGRALGFPGFDISAGAAVQGKPASDNLILRNAGVDAFGLATLQGSVALPLAGADAILRGVSYSGFSVIGAGLRYGVYRSGVAKFIPDVSLGVIYDAIDFDYFKGSHVSFDAAASLDLPFLKPYVVAGLDRTTIEARDLGGLNLPVNGAEATATSPRFTLGLRVSPLPLLYVYGAYNILHGEAGYSAGLGARF